MYESGLFEIILGLTVHCYHRSRHQASLPPPGFRVSVQDSLPLPQQTCRDCSEDIRTDVARSALKLGASVAQVVISGL